MSCCRVPSPKTGLTLLSYIDSKQTETAVTVTLTDVRIGTYFLGEASLPLLAYHSFTGF